MRLLSAPRYALKCYSGTTAYRLVSKRCTITAITYWFFIYIMRCCVTIYRTMKNKGVSYEKVGKQPIGKHWRMVGR